MLFHEKMLIFFRENMLKWHKLERFDGTSFGILFCSLLFIICSCMLQITVSIVHVEVVYLFFFTYLYVLVKTRLLFMREFTTR